MTGRGQPDMSATTAAVVLQQRMERLSEQRKAVEEACAQCGLQLTTLRKQRAQQELELAALERALFELTGKTKPPETH